MATTNRPYAGAADLSRLLDLLIAARLGSPCDKYPTSTEVRLDLGSPTFQADVQLWENTASGSLLGWATLQDSRWLRLYVRPDLPSGDLTLDIVDWAVDRVRQKPTGGQSPQLSIQVREDDFERIALLGRRGFVQGESSVLRMVRRLDEPLPAIRPPDGFTIRHVAGEQEVEAYVALHRDAFATSHLTVEHRLTFMRGPEYDPELDLVAVAPDGTLASFCVCSIYREENLRTGRREGWTDPIGTRPAFRRLGLARAVIAAGVGRLKERGIQSAVLGTGSWNANAIRLYESLGYRTAYRNLIFTMDL